MVINSGADQDVGLKAIQSGACVNTTFMSYRLTPLMCTARNGYEKVARALLENGADVNMRDAYGNTALHYAARHKRIGLVAMLVAQGADFRLKNRTGDSAYALAAKYSKRELLSLFYQEEKKRIAADFRAAAEKGTATRRKILRVKKPQASDGLRKGERHAF
ncbi:MAG: ankyrin repeat domain-containing protein [Alphaproteobacteria bacterium]|nr:ankyrin repeat domain-containing protein [Alphaproteobacteria bacterium]